MSTMEKTTAEEWDVSNADYHACTDIISRSMLEDFRQSRKRYHDVYIAAAVPKGEPTDAMLLGTYGHMGVLEFDRWQTEISVPPKCDRRTTAGKQAYAAFLESSAGKTIVDAEVWEHVESLRRTVAGSRLAQRLLTKAGPVEHSIQWTDEITGLRCKSRRDKIAGNIIVDLKFMTDRNGGCAVTPAAFANACNSRGLHRQAAWYVDGHLAKYHVDPAFLFLAVDTKFHEVAVFELDRESLDLGRRQNAKALADLKRCMETGDWLAPHEVQPTLISLPKYSFNEDYAL